MEQLEGKLGYQFQNPALLRHALCHSSYANEQRCEATTSNERLEFLGDSVLGMVTAEYLFRTQRAVGEGDLTRTRAALVCEGSLHDVAKTLNLGAHLQLGKGEEAGGGRSRPSILADAVEAIFAAVYLDGGLEAVRPIISKLILERGVIEAVRRDYKTALQEQVQRRPNQELCYILVDESGPDHDKIFTAAVKLNGEEIGRGTGRTKKEAEQAAAQAAFARLEQT